MDPLEHVAVKILGYSVKTRWQISLNYLLPSICELLVYITVIVVDSALVYQHILDESYLWAWITLTVVIVPAVLTFVCVMVSDQWPAEEGLGAERKKFFRRQLFNLILFPIAAIYRWVSHTLLLMRLRVVRVVESGGGGELLNILRVRE